MSLNTDEIIEVYNHLRKREPEEVAAEHGVDPLVLRRTVAAMAGSNPGSSLTDFGFAFFLLGAQIGAMRLDPIQYEPPDEQECNCVVCQFRKMIEDNLED